MLAWALLFTRLHLSLSSTPDIITKLVHNHHHPHNLDRIQSILHEIHNRNNSEPVPGHFLQELCNLAPDDTSVCRNSNRNCDRLHQQIGMMLLKEYQIHQRFHPDNLRYRSNPTLDKETKMMKDNDDSLLWKDCNLQDVIIRYMESAVYRTLNWKKKVRGVGGEEREENDERKKAVLNDMGIVYKQFGRFQDSLNVLRQGVNLYPKDLALRGNLASVLRMMGDLKGALEHIRIAVDTAPNVAALHHNYGLMLQEVSAFDEAAKQWRLALQLNPYLVSPYTALGNYEGHRGNVTGAEYYYQSALDIVRSDEGTVFDVNIPSLASLELQLATACVPVIYRSKDHIESVRLNYKSNLEQFIDSRMHSTAMDVITDPLISVGSGGLGYYIIYQGYTNDVVLRMLLAKAYWVAAPMLQYTASFLALDNDEIEYVESNDSGRIKVGFHSAFFYHHSVGLLLQGVIENLNRNKFKVYVFFQGELYDDHVAQRIKMNSINHDDVIIQLPNSIEVSRETIARYRLDVLIFSEIGMNSISYFLPFACLAKRTALFWGHAISSGISAVDAKEASMNHNIDCLGGIDYFISSRLFESNTNAQTRYSERLYLMNDLTTYFYPPVDPIPNVTRSYFDLPDDANIYLCPQTLYKLHPDFDYLLLQILLQDKAATIVFPTAHQKEYTEQIQERLLQVLSGITKHLSATDIMSRIVFVRRLSFSEFTALASIANVVLDPFPVGGGRSSFEIFSVNTPIVMHYPRTSILQLTYGMYKVMNISMGEDNCCIAYTDEDYINLALSIGTDRKREGHVRNLIESRKHRIYKSNIVIKEWEYFLSYITTHKRPSSVSSQFNEAISSSQDSIVDLDATFFIPNVQENSLIKNSSYAIKFRALPSDDVHVAYFTQHNKNVTKIAYELCSKLPRADPIMCEFIRNVLRHGQQRNEENIVATYPVRFLSNNAAWNEDIVVRFGDDLQAVSSFYGLKLGLNDKGIEHLFLFLEKRHTEHSSSQWINVRREQHAKRFEPFPVYVNNKNSCYLTIAVTTCKRLHLFREMMNSLKIRNIMKTGSVCDVLVIDDNSSIDDRMKMMSEYPDLTFVMKPVSDKGHAKSMNIIQGLTKTRYLLYIEDDWKSITDINIVIKQAMIVLRDENDQNNPVAQILLNDQSSRPCAEGQPECKVSKETAGWKREASCNGDTVSYAEHEFGVAYKEHKFAYWPGFSLNPAIWDLERIRGAIQIEFNEDDSRFEQSFALKALDAGLIFAHLPQHQHFQHIGSGQSSYMLNDMRRPWDE